MSNPINFNFLPYRENARLNVRRNFKISLIVSSVLAFLIVATIHFILGFFIAKQEARNSFLEESIKKEESSITTLVSLQAKTAVLQKKISSINRLYALQANLLDLMILLVKKVPNGVVLSSFYQKKDLISLRGLATDPDNVSSLMGNLQEVGLFSSVVLKEMKVIRQKGRLLNDFSIELVVPNTVEVVSSGLKQTSKP